jgi:hypothetical protein
MQHFPLCWIAKIKMLNLNSFSSLHLMNSSFRQKMSLKARIEEVFLRNRKHYLENTFSRVVNCITSHDMSVEEAEINSNVMHTCGTSDVLSFKTFFSYLWCR